MEIYYGNIKKANCVGCAGMLISGVKRFELVEEDVLFVKISENRYALLEDFVNGKKHPRVLKVCPMDIGERYASDLVSLNALLEERRQLLNNKDKIIHDNNIRILDNNKIILDQNTEIRKK